MFAANAHNDQKYPGQKAAYITHPAQVAAEVLGIWMQSPNFNLNFALQLALLHDVLEDTPTTIQEIETEFGEIVALGVDALSKKSDIPSPLRMAHSLDRILKQHDEVAIVKMCDRVCNLNQPPNHWPKSKVLGYLAEAHEIHQQLGARHDTAAQRLEVQMEYYKKIIQSLQ
jgi:(p)ppGpp synthase/HD superfamily hydrolase